MTEAIRELRAMRANYKAAGKLREAKAIDSAIARLRAKEGDGFAAREGK